MTSLLLLCAALLPCCQDPAPVPGADVVVLQSGEELRGKVLVEDEAHLEIRLGSDTTVGIDRATVREVRRGAATEAPASPAAVPPAPPAAAAPAAGFLAARDDWFVLHDGEGRCIGTLHATLRAGDQGELRLAEEWDFVTERGRTQVTQLETLHADGTASTCFYHERTLHPGERQPRDERLVRGTYAAGKLQVIRTTMLGSEQKEYVVGSGLTFPFALRETLRQRPGSVGGEGARLVYDAARDELMQQAFTSGERRRATIEGKTVDVRETRIGAGVARSTEWIDGSGRVVRREVAGPALVAVRATHDVAAAMVAANAKAYPAAVLREAEGRFALWLPNPIWRFDEEQAAGQVTAHASLYDASISALVLDQMAANAHLGMAGDAVERWLRVVCRDFKPRARQQVEVRAQAGLLIEGSYRGAIGERAVRCDVTVLVTRTPEDMFLALCLSAPANDHDGLRADFDRMVESLELHPAAVAAEARPGKRKITPR